MRQLVLLVCVFGIFASLIFPPSIQGGVIPSLETSSGKIGFYPITNEISFFQNYDDAGKDRGQTVQIVSINTFKLLTTFNFEFTADFNYDYTPGLSKDNYIELSIVKPITNIISLNIQRVISTFENKSINQYGFRLSL